MTSIFGMLGVDLTAPDHTTLSRRGQHLALALRRARPGTSLHLIVDSTGLSIVGEGEWAAATTSTGFFLGSLSFWPCNMGAEGDAAGGSSISAWTGPV